MTVSVSNEDDDEEDKRSAFSPPFVMIRCDYSTPAASNGMDLSFHRYVLSAPENGLPRTPSGLVKYGLICR
ncbi:MAG: hypothetical protein WCC86_10605 [Methanoregula sp.]|jgi:hypothetical protein